MHSKKNHKFTLNTSMNYYNCYVMIMLALLIERLVNTTPVKII